MLLIKYCFSNIKEGAPLVYRIRLSNQQRMTETMTKQRGHYAHEKSEETVGKLSGFVTLKINLKRLTGA